MLPHSFHRQRVPGSICEISVWHRQLRPGEPAQVPHHLQQAVLQPDPQVIVGFQVYT